MQRIGYAKTPFMRPSVYHKVEKKVWLLLLQRRFYFSLLSHRANKCAANQKLTAWSCRIAGMATVRAATATMSVTHSNVRIFEVARFYI